MKDIDKAAREYATFAVTDAETGEPVSYVNGCCEQAFKAGSDYMAVEMKRDILYYQQDIIDGLKREGIARKTISNKQVEIDELIEALEEATRWIPVSERLPDENKIVLIKCSINTKGDADGESAECAFIGWHNGARWSVSSKYLTVTHWRPIDIPKATQLLEKYGKK